MTPEASSFSRTVLPEHVRLHAKRELASPLTRVSGGEDLDRIADFPLKQPFEVGREAERFLPQRLHSPRFHEDVERSANRCEREDRRVRELPSLRAGDRSKSGLHPEARFLVVAPPAGQTRQIRPHAVPLVDEAAAHRARARVQVLVRAPHGEVHVPLVEAQDQVSRRVRQVEADDAPLRVRESRDRLDLEGLARVVLDSRKQDQGDRLTVAFEDLGDVRGIDRVLSLAGPQPHECFGRVEAVDDGLRLDRIVVRGERMLLEENPMPLAGRPIEARHHQVKVDGERVHRHDFVWRERGAHQPGHRLREELVVGHPWVLPREMRLDGEPLPLLQLLVDVLRSSFGRSPSELPTK